MSIKPQYETYRYTGEVCRLHSQSIVECRLPGSEIGSILAVTATAAPMECVAENGEVRYGGKLLVGVVYEDNDRNVCRLERGAEFFHKAENGNVTPACFAKVAFNADNVSYRREGSGLYISVIVGADIHVYGGRQLEYLTGGENVIAKTQAAEIYRTVCVSGEIEDEDEFDADYVGDILMHGENVLVTRVNAGAGQIEIEGELSVNVCVLKSENNVCSYERLIPITMQIPCDEAFGDVMASASVKVKAASIQAGVDEEKGKSKLVLSYTLAADCFLHAKEEIFTAIDAFSTQAKLTLKKEKEGGRYLTKTLKCIERVSGICSLSPALESDYTLAAAILPRAEIVCKRAENGVEAEGVLQAEVLLKGADGGYKTSSLSLPFMFPVDVAGAEVEADAIVCGLNVRRKKSGETEAEATLKICLRAYENAEWTYIREIEEGEAYEEKDAAISLFALHAGEEVWDVAKRLAYDPDELVKNNPGLEFPVKEGGNILVYRQIK